MKKILSLIFVLALSASLLLGCTPAPQAFVPTPAREETVHPAEPVTQVTVQPELLTGGVLCLKINPEIALHYDENGKVTKLEGRNADGAKIIAGVTDYAGKDMEQVLEELVQLIGKAGYFVEEADGTARRIVLELDPGSQVPHDQFLADMAAHVKGCVENKSWVGEREYDYNENSVPAPSEPAPTEPAPAKTDTSSGTAKNITTVPDDLCPTCADIDCDNGKHCDDAHEKAENLRAYERLMSGDVCPTCGDYECEDGKYCDDADEQAENLRENEAAKKKLSSGTSKTTTSTKKTTASTKNTTSGLCPVCADDDCDDGKYCDDADERAENLREAENKKNGVRCPVCGDYDCDDGKYCDDWDDRYDDDNDD